MQQNINSRFYGFVKALVVVLALSALYLYAFPAPTLFYAAMVLLHAGAGVIATLCLARFFWRFLRQLNRAAQLGWLLFTAGAGLGVVLIYTGTTRAQVKWLYLHIAVSAVAIVVLTADALARRLSVRFNVGVMKLRFAGVLLLLAVTAGICVCRQVIA